MKTTLILCGAVAGMLPVTVQAQANSDDLRCLLLSVSYARAAKDPNTRQVSAMTGAFYLGRVNGRLSGPALSDAIRAQGKGLPAKEAEAAMRACAARAASAQQQLAIAAKQAGISN